MAKCYACGRFIGQTEGAACSTCPLIYHSGCLGRTKIGKISKSWSCPECVKNKPRDNGADTPVKNAEDLQVAVTEIKTCTPQVHVGSRDDSCVLLHDNIPTSVTKDTTVDLVTEIRLFREQMRELQEEVKLMRHGFDELRNDNNSRIVALEDRVETLEQNVAKKQDYAENVETVISKIMTDLNDRDQEWLTNDLEITNIPESSAENPMHIVTMVGTKLGVTIDARDIVYAERVGSPRSSQGSSGAGVSRPRPLVVRLVRRHHRDEIIKNIRVRRNADTADFGLASESRPFYVNERLTKYNRQLLFKTREVRKRMEWKYVWTKRGQILVKQAEGAKTHRIRTESDLTRVFGIESVQSTTTTDIANASQ